MSEASLTLNRAPGAEWARADRSASKITSSDARVEFTISGWRSWYLRTVIVPLLGAMGFRAASSVARQIGRWVWELNLPARAQAEERIAAAEREGVCLGGNPSEIIRRCYEHAAQLGVEWLYLTKRPGGCKWDRLVRGAENTLLRTACSDPGPAIFVTGYTGNPVAAAHGLGHLCRPIHVLVDLPRDPLIDAWTHRWERSGRVRLIPRNRALEALPGALAGGGKVLLVGEHFRRNGRGDAVSFLGRTRRCNPTARILCRRYEAPIHVLACHRIGSEFDFEIRMAGTVRPDADHISRRMMTLLERTVVLEPAQYLWLIGDSSPSDETPAELTTDSTRPDRGCPAP